MARCAKVGVEVKQFLLPADASQEELLRVIAGINADAAIHGCLLFRPLPKQFDDRTIRAALSPEKDIDGITDGVVSGEIVPLQKEAARHTGCRVIDINALTRGHEAWTVDGIHPSDEGYAHLAGAFAHALSEALSADRRKTHD